MNDSDLIDLRDFLESKGGQLVLRYAADFMIEAASSANTNAEWIKGMGMLINHLKGVDEMCRKNFNRKE